MALYHRWPGPARLKPVLQRIDHSTIFVLIAASYTPIVPFVGARAARVDTPQRRVDRCRAGVAFSLGWIEAPRGVIAASYLAVGWVAGIAIPQLLGELHAAPLVLLYAIGVSSTQGSIRDPWPRTSGFHRDSTRS